MQNTANTQQHSCVNGWLLIYLIYVCPVTTQFTGKPDRGFTSLSHFLAYLLPNVNHSLTFFAVTNKAKKYA